MFIRCRCFTVNTMYNRVELNVYLGNVIYAFLYSKVANVNEQKGSEKKEEEQR